MSSKVNMMNTWSLFHAQRGFTLLEAMITVAILAILISIGVPSFRDTVERNRVTTVANSLLYHLQLARSEAVKRNQNIIFCPTTNGNTCSTDVLDWSNQWIIVINNDNSAEDVVRNFKVADAVNVEPHPNDTEQVLFSAIGITSGGNNPYFIITVGNTVDNKTRYVCLRISGTAEVSLISCP